MSISKPKYKIDDCVLDVEFGLIKVLARFYDAEDSEWRYITVTQKGGIVAVSEDDLSLVSTDFPEVHIS